MGHVLFILAALGVIYVIVESALFVIPRVWLASRSKHFEIFLYCPFCVGFWVGAGLKLLTQPFDGRLPLEAFLGGCIVMGVVLLLRTAWPDFLTGAHEREHEVIEYLRKPAGDSADERSAG